MTDPKIARFWDKFIAISKRCGISQRALRWHVRHAERYIKAHEGLKLSAHTPDHVAAYLETLAGWPGMQDWQYRQVIKSLQILFVEVLCAPWARGFAWRERAEAATPLPADHPTLARDRGVQAILPEPGPTNSGADSALRKAWQQYPAHFERLVAAIRVRGYSIRTEKTYGDWLARYICHHQMRDPAALTPACIARYLEHLAVQRNVSASTQSQALSALVFFYARVLGIEIGDIGGFTLAKKPDGNKWSSGPMSSSRSEPALPSRSTMR